MPNLTAQQKQQLQALGLDVGKLDWKKIALILQTLLGLFGGSDQPPVAMATGPSEQHRQLAKSVGCPDDKLDECCACMQAGTLALESARISFEHCSTCQ